MLSATAAGSLAYDFRHHNTIKKDINLKAITEHAVYAVHSKSVCLYVVLSMTVFNFSVRSVQLTYVNQNSWYLFVEG